MRKYIIALLFFVIVQSSLAQQKRGEALPLYVDSLKYYMNIMFNAPYDMERLKAHEEFRKYVFLNLQNEQVFEMSFDAVPVLYSIMPSNKIFRMITYGFPLEDGAVYEIHGFMVIRGKPNKVIELMNVKKSLTEDPEYISLRNGEWYGAVYYQLIEKKYKKKNYYLLIGWNGENPYFYEKIIEPLDFDSRGMPVFGKNYFRGKGYAKKKRILLRYSPSAAVVARYQPITYRNVDVIRKEKTSGKNWKRKDFSKAQEGWKRKVKVKEITEELVVFDHLAPVNKEFEQFYAFYFPRDDRMNGLRFNKGKWEHVILTNVVVEKNTRKINEGLVPKDWTVPWK